MFESLVNMFEEWGQLFEINWKEFINVQIYIEFSQYRIIFFHCHFRDIAYIYKFGMRVNLNCIMGGVPGLREQLKLAREYATEGLYDTSIIFFDSAIAQIDK